MGVQISHGQIKRLLSHFQLTPIRKGSDLYEGVGNDGHFRIVKFDYHKDREIAAKGTANKIAKDLLFKNAEEMKKYLDNL